jgi:nicotinamidase-related amidase
MRHPSLLDRARTALVVVDVQERYRTVLHGWEGVVDAVTILLRGTQILGIPLVVTEQYPTGLGRTAAELREHLPADLQVIEKLSLSAWGAPAFRDRLTAMNRSQVVLVGIEAHACILQTAHDLLAANIQVHVPRDATSSRHAADVPVAWDKMRAAGMLPTSSEQVLLELLRTAESPEFRTIQGLLKEARRS